MAVSREPPPHENAEIRKGAERDRAKDRAAVADLADKLAATTADCVRAEQQVPEYAAENERLADTLAQPRLNVTG